MAKTITLHGHNYIVMSKSKAQSAYRAFTRSSNYDLRDVYGRYSRAKENAFNYCLARQSEFDAYDGGVHMDKKKYSVTVYWLLTVKQFKQNLDGTFTIVRYVRCWVRQFKYFFRTKKEALKYASACALHYTKATIRREVR